MLSALEGQMTGSHLWLALSK